MYTPDLTIAQCNSKALTDQSMTRSKEVLIKPSSATAQRQIHFLMSKYPV